MNLIISILLFLITAPLYANLEVYSPQEVEKNFTEWRKGQKEIKENPLIPYISHLTQDVQKTNDKKWALTLQHILEGKSAWKIDAKQIATPEQTKIMIGAALRSEYILQNLNPGKKTYEHDPNLTVKRGAFFKQHGILEMKGHLKELYASYRTARETYKLYRTIVETQMKKTEGADVILIQLDDILQKATSISDFEKPVSEIITKLRGVTGTVIEGRLKNISMTLLQKRIDGLSKNQDSYYDVYRKLLDTNFKNDENLKKFHDCFMRYGKNDVAKVYFTDMKKNFEIPRPIDFNYLSYRSSNNPEMNIVLVMSQGKTKPPLIFRGLKGNKRKYYESDDTNCSEDDFKNAAEEFLKNKDDSLDNLEGAIRLRFNKHRYKIVTETQEIGKRTRTLTREKSKKSN